jgi:hypothetical protein
VITVYESKIIRRQVMKNNLFYALFIFFLIYNSLTSWSQDKKVIGKWELVEFSFKNEKIYDNPFRDVALIGEFRNLKSGRELKIYGFYDGGYIWRIRFMPNEEGEWKYKLYFSDGSTKPIEGSFLCKPSNIRGPLRIYSPNSIWFCTADGSPFFLFAYDMEEADVVAEMGKLEDTLDFVQKFGFNAIVAPHCGFSGIPGIGYRVPWVNTGEGFDFSRYDLRFWRNMDKVLFSLKRRNMYLIPANIFGGTNGVPRMPREEWENFVSYWTARWSGFYNATFQPITEWEEGFRPVEVLEILELIRKYDPWQRLISVHSWNYSKKALEICSSPFYDYFTLQDKLIDWDYHKYKGLMEEIQRVAKKPILAQECIWEGDGYQGEAGLDVANLRKACWTILLSGAHLSYGDQVTPPREIGRNGIFFGNWGKLMEPAGLLYPYLKFMYQVLTSVPWWKMKPNPQIENKNVVCLASTDKSVFLVYLPEGGNVVLYSVSGGFEVKYLDPVKCREEKKEKIRAKEKKLVIRVEGEKVLMIRLIER